MLVYRFLWILYAPGVLSLSGRLMHSGRGRRLYGISQKVYRKFPASGISFFRDLRQAVLLCAKDRLHLFRQPLFVARKAGDRNYSSTSSKWA